MVERHEEYIFSVPPHYFRDLIKLNLGKNRLEKIPHKALAGLAYLQHLEFSDNHISDIDAGSFEGNGLMRHRINVAVQIEKKA